MSCCPECAWKKLDAFAKEALEALYWSTAPQRIAPFIRVQLTRDSLIKMDKTDDTGTYWTITGDGEAAIRAGEKLGHVQLDAS